MLVDRTCRDRRSTIFPISRVTSMTETPDMAAFKDYKQQRGSGVVFFDKRM